MRANNRKFLPVPLRLGCGSDEQTIKATPAMAAGLAVQRWSLGKLLTQAGKDNHLAEDFHGDPGPISIQISSLVFRSLYPLAGDSGGT